MTITKTERTKKTTKVVEEHEPTEPIKTGMGVNAPKWCRFTIKRPNKDKRPQIVLGKVATKPPVNHKIFLRLKNILSFEETADGMVITYASIGHTMQYMVIESRKDIEGLLFGDTQDR